MITLNSTQKLTVVLNSNKTANDCDFIVTYTDMIMGVIEKGQLTGKTNGIIPVILCDQPKFGITRIIDRIQVINNDTVVSIVSIKLTNINDISRVIKKSTLQINESLQFVEGNFTIVSEFVNYDSGTKRFTNISMSADQTTVTVGTKVYFNTNSNSSLVPLSSYIFTLYKNKTYIIMANFAVLFSAATGWMTFALNNITQGTVSGKCYSFAIDAAQYGDASPIFAMHRHTADCTFSITITGNNLGTRIYSSNSFLRVHAL